MYKRYDILKQFNIQAMYTFFKQSFNENYSFEGEEHNFWEVVCVTHGNVGATVGSELYILGEGRAIVHSPGEFHNLWSESKDAQAIIFSFDGTIPSEKKRIYTISEQNFGEIISIFEDAHSCFILDGQDVLGVLNGKERTAEKVIKRLELFMMDLMANENSDIFGIQTKSAINYMNIVSVLSQNIDKNIQIKDIAKLCNMSESNVKKIFKKYSGVGIMHYFNSLKIKKAQSLLESGYSVREAAEALGFADQNYFSAAFKRVVGKSPIKYKR